MTRGAAPLPRLLSVKLEYGFCDNGYFFKFKFYHFLKTYDSLKSYITINFGIIMDEANDVIWALQAMIAEAPSKNLKKLILKGSELLFEQEK